MTVREPALEQDGRFPSGAWTGFFLQRPSTARHWMDLRLTFRGGTLHGDGHDQIGAFTLDGHYDLADGRCWWSKRYVGQHEVSYAGHNEGKGIWGVWEIPPWGRGGFHIWPAGMADPTRETRTTQEQAPVEAVSRRGVATPVGPSAGRPLSTASLAEPRHGLPRVRLSLTGWPRQSHRLDEAVRLIDALLRILDDRPRLSSSLDRPLST